MSTADIRAGHLEQLKHYITTMLDADVEQVTISELAKNTPVPKEKARVVMDAMSKEPRTGVSHVDGETYEIERRR